MKISRFITSIVMGAMLTCSAATTVPARPAVIPAETGDNPKVKEDKDYRAATFRVNVPGGTGSGFAIGPRMVVTCAHVVLDDDDELNEPVTLDDGNDRKGIAARVVYYDTGTDIALLNTDETFEVYYRIAEHPPEVGAHVAIVRSRPNYVAKFSRTKIRDGWDERRGSMLVDKRVEFGNSGSPVVNARYEVVGYIAWLTMDDHRGIYVPAASIRAALGMYVTIRSTAPATVP